MKFKFPVENSLLKIEHFPKGFSLIELITVLTIFVLLMGAAIGGYFAWNQTASLRGGTDLTLATLRRARGFAITQRVQTYFHIERYYDSHAFDHPRFALSICTNALPGGELPQWKDLIPIAPRQTLPRNVILHDLFPEGGDLSIYFAFNPEGLPLFFSDPLPLSDQGDIPLTLLLQRYGTNLTSTIYLDPLTGHARR